MGERKKTEFKVWNTIRKTWISGIPLFEELIEDELNEIDSRAADELLMEPFYPANPDTYNGKLIWLEYTTLNDANYTKIYDGDLVADYFGNVFEIVWDNKEGRWAAESEGMYYSIKGDQLHIVGHALENKTEELKHKYKALSSMRAGFIQQKSNKTEPRTDTFIMGDTIINI